MCLPSQTDLRKLLRQIQGRNSICRGDERSDRVVREERRIKGREEEHECRVTALGPPGSSLPTLVFRHFHKTVLQNGYKDQSRKPLMEFSEIK